MPEESGRQERRWLRPAALLLLTFVIAVVPFTALIAIPFVLLAALLPRTGNAAIIVAGLAVGLVVAAPITDGLWYAVRGWALLLGGSVYVFIPDHG